MTSQRQKQAAQKNIKKEQKKRSSGSWADQAWLISKKDAHIEDEKLIADSSGARKILAVIGPAKHLKADIFQGHPRRNVPESEKSTIAQRRAGTENIQRAQEARWS
ncbi:hypothetical protein HY612_04625 [Candidatus Roizmanbacteria bacterium]|nr:hypothetical protein [Candidatus Roizmanbacteria bacterium]